MNIITLFNQTSPYILTLLTGAVGAQIFNHYILGKRERDRLIDQQRKRFYIPVYNLLIIYLERNTAQLAEDELKVITKYQLRSELLDFIEKNLENANDEVIEDFHVMNSSRYVLRQQKILEREIVHLFFYKILRSYFDIAIRNKNELKVNILFFQLFRLVDKLYLNGSFNEISYNEYFDPKKLLKLYSFKDFEIILKEDDENKMKNFLKEFIEQVALSDPNQVWNRFNTYQDSYVNNITNVHQIMNDNKDVTDKPLSMYNRQYLRDKLLFSLYVDYFEKDIEYTVSDFNNLHREKRLVFNLYKEKGLIKIETNKNRVLIRLTEKAIEQVEKQEIKFIGSKKAILASRSDS